MAKHPHFGERFKTSVFTLNIHKEDGQDVNSGQSVTFLNV